jgi:ribose 5-phosphate isomerase B
VSLFAKSGFVQVPSEDEVRRLVAAVLAEVTSGQAEVTDRGGADLSVPANEPDALAEVAIGADHGGYRLKERIAADLRERGARVHDCGTDGTEPVDYPDFAHSVARLVAEGECRWGIVVDGAGIGSCMAANKVPGIRAALCYDEATARNSREHNFANVLTLGGRMIQAEAMRRIVKIWLETPFGEERHARRVRKIAAIEAKYLRNPVEG